ncbi:phage tail tape measure protein [Runella zeae]|uniref:phage tail tape measure protein n=1 Tax=Runella zeae TaxID=94255 RepID=UPI0023563AD7|nr:phage tail tape measure protein [Runella zeae]
MELRDKSILDLYINGEAAVDSLKKLDTEIDSLKKQQKELKKELEMKDLDPAKREELMKSYKEVSDKIRDCTQAKEMLRKEMDMEELSIKELKQLLRDYRKEWETATDPAIREAMRAKMDMVNDRLKDLGVNVRSQESIWSTFRGWITASFSAEGILQMLQALVDFARESLKLGAEISDSFADIRKSTGMTTEEVEELSRTIEKIDTRTAQQSLLDIAKVGGQIGIAKDEMLGFVEATDKAVVALGDEFQGGAEEVAAKMGTLKQLFSDTKELDAGTAINKIGSAINELGAAGSATGPVMADFATRIGQLGNLAPQINQTLGLGAAFQELGLTAEIAAGGLTNILLGASKATGLFAEHLGMTEQAFKDLINTNPNEVILRLAESFRGLPTDVVVKQLDNLGIKSQEATKVMSLLSDQTTIVREKQELAAKAMEEATSLTNEFNIKNNTAAAELEKAEKAVTTLKIQLGQALLPVVLQVITGLVGFVNVIRAIPEFIAENKEMFIALGTAVLAFNGHLIVATASSLAHAAAEKARLIWTESATVAQWAMNTAMTANPIGAVIAAIALLVGGLMTLWKNSETVRGIVLGLWEALKIGVSIVVELAEAIWKGIQQLVERFPMIGTVVQAIWNGIKFAFSALVDLLGEVGDKIEWLIDFFASLFQGIANFAQSVGSLLSPAFDFVKSGFNSLKEAVNGFLSMIGNVGAKIASALRAITPDAFVDAINIFKNAGERISNAFNSAFSSEQAKGHKQQEDADRASNDRKVADKKKAAAQIAKDDEDTAKSSLNKIGQATTEHLTKEQQKARDAAKKSAEEKIKAEKDALKIIEDANIKAIKDDQERELAKLALSLKREVERVAQSKASTATKVAWEKALTEQYERDIAKVQDDYRKKSLADNQAIARQISKLKTDLITDELEKKKVQLKTELDAELAKNQTAKGDAELKAQYETMLRQKYKNDVEKLEEDYRKKHVDEEKKRLDEIKKLEDSQRENLHTAEREAMKATLQTKLQDETLNINQRKDLKLQLIRLEHEAEMQKIEQIASKEKAEAQATSDKLMALAKNDATRKNEIATQLDQQIRTIDSKLIADKTKADADYQANLRKTEAESLKERQANQEAFFSALKRLMTGDFNGFIDFLNQKFKNEKAMNDARLQNWTSKGQQILQVVEMGVMAIQKMNEAQLQKQLANINKEKNAQLASWKEQYDKGLISKDQYEKKVSEINADAAAKEKAEKLKAWKREQQMQIVMAVIHAAMAALKSLATMGWPLGLIGVAAAAAMAAVQIAQIKRQQPPDFAKGGFLKNGGVAEGPRHGSRYGQSGIALVRRDSGDEVGEMEGGEPIMILSRNTYQNNRRTVDALLHSSLHRNGAPIHAEKGAMFLEGGSFSASDSEGDNRSFDPGYSGGSSSNYSNSNTNNDSGQGYSSFNSGDTSDGYSSSGDSYDGSGDYGGENPDTGAASESVSMTNEQIEKSQAMMENIEKNTAKTAVEVQTGFQQNAEMMASNLQQMSQNMNYAVSRLNESFEKLLTVVNESVAVEKVIALNTRKMAEKELSVSVTTINQINNYIDVIVDKSSFK